MNMKPIIEFFTKSPESSFGGQYLSKPVAYSFDELFKLTDDLTGEVGSIALT